MTNLENYQLVHPELLTEDTLLQVLRERCIVVPQLKSSSKTELVEIFKRIALPLPQRIYDHRTPLGRKLIDLRKSKGQQEAASPGVAPTSTDTGSSLKSNGSATHLGGRIVERLKPPLVGVGTESKKIRLSKSSTIQDAQCDADKRKRKETLQETADHRKRQKITWP